MSTDSAATRPQEAPTAQPTTTPPDQAAGSNQSLQAATGLRVTIHTDVLSGQNSRVTADVDGVWAFLHSRGVSWGDFQALQRRVENDPSATDADRAALEQAFSEISSQDPDGTSPLPAPQDTTAALDAGNISDLHSTAAQNTIQGAVNAVTNAPPNDRTGPVLNLFSQLCAADPQHNPADAWAKVRDTVASSDPTNRLGVDPSFKAANTLIESDDQTKPYRTSRPDVAGKIALADYNAARYNFSGDAIKNLNKVEGLTPDEVGTYATTLGSSAPTISGKARDGFNALFADDKTPSADDVRGYFKQQSFVGDQQAVFHAKNPTRPDSSTANNADGSSTVTVRMPDGDVPVEISKPEPGTDGTNHWNTSVYTVKGQKIQVSSPQDLTPDNGATPDTIACWLAALDPSSLNAATHRNIEVHTNHPAGGAATTASVIRLYTGQSFNDPQTFQANLGTLTHELGHAVNTDQLSRQDLLAYQQAIKDDPVSPTVYARDTATFPQNGAEAIPQEDFAETWALYQNVVGTPLEAQYRSMMPARFSLMDKYNAQVQKTGPGSGFAALTQIYADPEDFS